ncbi:hypothetical protein [Luteococcus japonicus]|uniref:hypothetical protein n=1 Tax=Luteococcus japonicus TaxID=33984 RepID=UPI0011CED1E7|nr:hypothetical protein [Luteococcus japonicus]
MGIHRSVDVELTKFAGRGSGAKSPARTKEDLDAAVQAIEQTSVINRKIHAAATQFYDVWREHHGAPADKAAWQWANKYLDKVEDQLKQNRESDLARRVDSFVSNLLDDAGLNVRNVKVQKSRADFVLERASGASDSDTQDSREIQLGMLSAGQRNAVILAPALAVAENGPFGFMILDDPVHAFDELRVDRTAKALVQIARARRVIVLTHDERLKEQLLAASVDVDVRSISRNSSGTLEVLSADAVWRLLLEDARRLFGLGHLTPLSTSIRGLCRQAVDNALRLFVTQQAAKNGASPDAWLGQLDAVNVNKLSDRFSAARRPGIDAAGLNALAKAKALLTDYEEPWNRAAHGQPSQCPGKEKVTEAELDTAEAIGETLTGTHHV